MMPPPSPDSSASVRKPIGSMRSSRATMPPRIALVRTPTRSMTANSSPMVDTGYSGRRSSGFSTSSMLTSLKVMTRTCLTNRAGRYMSQTQASARRSSK
ncbi:Uncharacterised protein [Mycobacteroides abscessus subsp. abscessus]|nr:Uncharacterised protein [Mycobacteroides abscessus subsp. abscessus]